MDDEKHVLIVTDNRVGSDLFRYEGYAERYGAVLHIAHLESSYAEFDDETLPSVQDKLKEFESRGISPNLIVLEDTKNMALPNPKAVHDLATTDVIAVIPDDAVREIVRMVEENEAPTIAEATKSYVSERLNDVEFDIDWPEEFGRLTAEDFLNSEMGKEEIRKMEDFYDQVKRAKERVWVAQKILANSNYSDAVEKYATALRPVFPDARIIATGLFSDRRFELEGIVDHASRLGDDYWQDHFKETLYPEAERRSDIKKARETISQVTGARLKKELNLKKFSEKVQQKKSKQSSEEIHPLSCYKILEVMKEEKIIFDIPALQAPKEAINELFSRVDTECRKDFNPDKYRMTDSDYAREELVRRFGWQGLAKQREAELYADELIDYIKAGLYAYDPETYVKPKRVRAI